MSVNLVKGDKISLSKDKTLNSIRLGLGWLTRADLDSIVFMTDSDGVIRDNVYFGKRRAKGIKHNGDNLIGGKKGDCETIDITLDELPKWCTRLQLCVNIYTTLGTLCNINLRKFGTVKESYVRLVDKDDDEELCKFYLTDEVKKFNAIHFADLYRSDSGEWHFEAIGEGMNGNIVKLRRKLSR